MMEFRAFPKIARLSREIVITEKIDGTNASIYIEQVAVDDEVIPLEAMEPGWLYLPHVGIRMRFGSRTRWITPDNDNHGFARWGYKNAMELAHLGVGHHFGEWWGGSIQRGYGLQEKRFSLFDVSRWGDFGLRLAPSCCHVVPVLYRGSFRTDLIDEVVDSLSRNGSSAAPGYMNPEGIIVYHTAANIRFKKTLVKDDQPKGA